MYKKHGLKENQLGSTLRTLREEQRLTREWVADNADIGLRHLAAIELGEKNPSVDTLYRLIRVIGVSADRVFYPEHKVKEGSLKRIECLVAICTPKQRKLLVRLLRHPYGSFLRAIPSEILPILIQSFSVRNGDEIAFEASTLRAEPFPLQAKITECGDDALPDVLLVFKRLAQTPHSMYPYCSTRVAEPASKSFRKIVKISHPSISSPSSLPVNSTGNGEWGHPLTLYSERCSKDKKGSVAE